MRLLAAGLLVAALLVLPTAAAVSSALGLSGAGAVVDLTNSPTTYVPVTVSLRISSGFFCQNDDTATVTLALSTTGPITASLNTTSVKFAIPADASPNVDPNNPSVPTGGHEATDYNAQMPVNLTLGRTDAGNGTATIVATWDGKLSSCQANPDPTNPTATTGFDPATKSLNISTQSLTGNVNNTTASPTPTTPTNLTTTPSSPSPVSTSPAVTTVGDNPTPAPTETAKKGLPGPEVPLVLAAAAGLAMLVRRRVR